MRFADAILHQLLNGFAENIRFPDAFASLSTLANVLDQVFCLLLCTYDWRDLRLDFCFDHMDGWAF